MGTLYGFILRLDFRTSQRHFYESVDELFALDDDLMGECSNDWRVKSLPDCKAVCDGKLAYCKADAVFCTSLYWKFQRHSEAQINSVQNIYWKFYGSKGKLDISNCTFIADRGYGRLEYIQQLRELGYSIIMIITTHQLSVHLFVEFWLRKVGS